MPQIDTPAMEYQVREACAGVAAEAGQPMDRNATLESGNVTIAAWRKVYNFPIRGEGMVMRGEKYMEDKFANPSHPKDGYPLPECKDSRARRMLEFVVPIHTLRSLHE